MKGQKGLLTRAEVAVLFGVAPNTVTRWSRTGKLPSVRTLGGQHRYRKEIIAGLIQQLESQERSPSHGTD